MTQAAFVEFAREWWRGTQIVYDKRSGDLYRVADAEWVGDDGILTCFLLFDDDDAKPRKISFSRLENLNEMEVIAAAANV